MHTARVSRGSPCAPCDGSVPPPAPPTSQSAALFTFHRNWRKLRSTIVHFQLRNLLWCPTPTDMYTVYQNRVVGFNTCTRRASVVRQCRNAGGARGGSPPAAADRLGSPQRAALYTPSSPNPPLPQSRPGRPWQVMDVGGGIGAPGAPGIGPAQVCTACVRYGLAAGGGFAGELVVRRLGAAEEFCHSGRVTESENGITNAIEIARGRSGATYVLCSNNDERVRILDASTFQTVRCDVHVRARRMCRAGVGGAGEAAQRRGPPGLAAEGWVLRLTETKPAPAIGALDSSAAGPSQPAASALLLPLDSRAHVRIHTRARTGLRTCARAHTRSQDAPAAVGGQHDGGAAGGSAAVLGGRRPRRARV